MFCFLHVCEGYLSIHSFIEFICCIFQLALLDVLLAPGMVQTLSALTCARPAMLSRLTERVRVSFM